MIYCRKCGKEIPDDSKFCSACGQTTDITEGADNTTAKTSASYITCPKCGASNFSEAIISAKDFTNDIVYNYHCHNCGKTWRINPHAKRDKILIFVILAIILFFFFWGFGVGVGFWFGNFD